MDRCSLAKVKRMKATSSMGFIAHLIALQGTTHSIENIEFRKCSNVYLCLFLPALHEFPTDLFTNKERTEGAVALHVLCVSTCTHRSTQKNQRDVTEGVVSPPELILDIDK